MNFEVIFGTPLALEMIIFWFHFRGVFSAMFSNVFMVCLEWLWHCCLAICLPLFGKRENGEICTPHRREACFHDFCSSEIRGNLRKIEAESRSIFIIDFGVIFKGWPTGVLTS